ncbi:MAG: hypothetical protein DRR42_03475 [Gammaproteobacteria bacterium]|nr:MAG: hypothetical protein DRR42_03475 [Gammaproteobacteria bacterium]
MEHNRIEAEQERQLQEQHESAKLIDSQMSATERKVMEQVAADDAHRQQAAIESRERQIEGTTIFDTAGVDNRNSTLWDFVHGFVWWAATDTAKDTLR